MSRNLKITLAYDGSEFHGWQIQPGFPTVQGILAECLGRITGENVLPQGSGRTDAGVHALAQVASVRIKSPIPERNLLIALNDILPPAVRVTGVEIVEDEFSCAPFGARQRPIVIAFTGATFVRRFWRATSITIPIPWTKKP